MKIINKFLAGALVVSATALTFQSCDLDEYNPSGETADVVFSTPEGMELLTNELYENFRKKFYGREDPCLQMEGGSDLWQNIATSYEYGMQQTRCVSMQGDLGQMMNCWSFVYDVVNTANAVIGRIDNVNYSNQDKKDTHKGEAKFMRSFCYWWLVEYFGDIVMKTEETTTPEFTCVRTPREQIYDEVIIPDAKDAVELLKKDPRYPGCPSKKAAYALLARVLLTRASYEKDATAQKKLYTAAYEAAEEVINHKDKYGVGTYDTYDEIWQAKNNKNNKEFLWVTTFSSNTSLDADSKPNRIYRYFSPILVDRAGEEGAAIKNSGSSWEYPSVGSGLLMPSYYFLNLYADWDQRYDCVFQEDFYSNNAKNVSWDALHAAYFKQPTLDGKRIKPGALALQFTRQHIDASVEQTASYAIVDIDKLYHTEAVNEYGGARVRNYKSEDEAEAKSTTQYIASSFPRFMKYRVWDREENGTFLLAAANGQVGYGDVPMMRYAELPLIAAECHIALGEQDKAKEIINKEIRTARVVKPGHDVSEAQVKASDMTIDWIMEERARELCGEWVRWFDCKRVYAPKGVFAKTIRGRNPSMTGDDCLEEYHALRPIPNKFLDKLLNAEEFGQNPGYAPYVVTK